MKPRRDFAKLLTVCLKMLFRRSTRTRFVLLVSVFLAMMLFNTGGYIARLHRTELQKRDLLGEKAFKVFFLRMRTQNDLARFIRARRRALERLNARMVAEAFVYQNNLFVHVPRPSETLAPRQTAALDLLYAVFNVDRGLRQLYAHGLKPAEVDVFRNVYVNHNGLNLGKALRQGRHVRLQRDMVDLADSIRGGLAGRRMMVFNDIRLRLIQTMAPVPTDERRPPNPFVSRVNAVVPLTLCHLFYNLRRDNTTDVFDLAGMIRDLGDQKVETYGSFLRRPEPFNGASLYGEIDAYPRYLPLHAPGILTERWHRLLYRDVVLDRELNDYIERLHSRGHYLLSYEKLQILRARAERISRDLFDNQLQFYLTDLTLGVAFAFMMSLFAFVHLKAELAFLLMFRNRIRQLLRIFWLLPLALILAVKLVVIAFFWLRPDTTAAMLQVILLPPAVSFAAAAVVFYPVNRWCFGPFTGYRLNLYSLHRG